MRCLGAAVVVSAFVVVLGISICGQEHPMATIRPFEVGQKNRWDAARGGQVPGCSCGDSDVQITPSPVRGTAGQLVTVKFDAAGICKGQTVRDRKGNSMSIPQQRAVARLGTVKWETLSVEDLSDSYGQLSHTYTQAGTYFVDINIDVQCYDTGALCKAKDNYNVCTASGKATVNIR